MSDSSLMHIRKICAMSPKSYAYSHGIFVLGTMIWFLICPVQPQHKEIVVMYIFFTAEKLVIVCRITNADLNFCSQNFTHWAAEIRNYYLDFYVLFRELA
jgi:hypothetical protein